MYASVGTVAAVALMIWIGRQKPGWRLMAASVVVSAPTVYELKNVDAYSQALVLSGLSAALIGGAWLSRPRRLAALAVLVCATITPAVTQSTGLRAGGVGNKFEFHVSALTLASLSGLILLAMEARSRSATIRGLESQLEVSRRVWDAAANGMALLDLDGRVRDWNPGMERLTGITRRVAFGMLITDCPGLHAGTSHPECFRIAAQGVEMAAEADRSTFGGYYSPVRSASGEIAGVFALIFPAASKISTPVLNRQALKAYVA